MRRHIRSEKNEAQIYHVVFDMHGSEVNKFNEEMIAELEDIADEITADSSCKGIVFSSAKKDFFVGADINEFTRINNAEEAKYAASRLQSVFHRIATLKVPSVAAIKGNCVGGGFEFVLALDYRVLSNADNTVLSLPEIQLGLIPGGGGTQRLPRLIGIQQALDYVLTGKKMRGKKALKLGAADALVPENLLIAEAEKWAGKKKRSGESNRHGNFTSNISKIALESNPFGRKIMRSKATEMVEQKTKGFYPASQKALEAIFEGIDLKIEKALELEAKLFGECFVTYQSKSLIHLFHATTALKKNPYAEEAGGKPAINSVGIIGAGFMGSGIANVCANKGIRVILSDPSETSLSKALQNANSYFSKMKKRKIIKSYEVAQKIAHISPGTTTKGMESCDIVIEAVFEDAGLKQKILAEIEDRQKKDQVFASNTSALPIKNIAQNSKDKSKVLGMHFFSPVEKMPLLEIVKTGDTSAASLNAAFELGKIMGKQIIVVKDSPGFYTTRALAFFMAEAAQILLEGAKIERIDKALTDYGFPVGPMTLTDEVGIDVGLHVLETMHETFPDRIPESSSMKLLVDNNRLGRKNGSGLYKYVDGKKAGADQAVYSLLKIDTSKNSEHDSEDIRDRCLYQFVNESAYCLEEGVINHPFDGDVGAVFGLGFPPFWGGPFKFVDHKGAKQVVSRMHELSQKYGERFKPAQILIDKAERNELFFPEEGKS